MKCKCARVRHFRMGKSFRLNAPSNDGTCSQGVDKITNSQPVCARSWLSCSVMILMNDLQVAACGARCDAMLHQTAVSVIMIMMMRCGGGGVCCGENLLKCCGSRKGG